MKNNLLLLASFIPITVLASAEGDPRGWLEPRPDDGKKLEYRLGDEITIKGANLQGKYDMEAGYPPKKEVCLILQYSTSDRVCIPHSDARITRWTNNVITLNLPEDVYSETKVSLRFQEYKEKCNKGRLGSQICDDEWTWATDTEIGDFIVKSVVDSANIKDGKIAKAMGMGQTYIIHGKFFGQSQGRIFIDGTEVARSDVVKWLPDMIEVKLTSVSGTRLEIDNGQGKGLLILSDQKSINTDVEVKTPVAEANVRESIFIDVQDTNPYLPAIGWGKSSGVVSGYPDGTFHPDNPVNRAEFLKIIIEADSSANVALATNPANFPDVDENAWYAPYVRYAKQNNIVEGYPDGTFRPEKSVNFAEALKIAYEALGVQTESVSGEWYSKYLAHAKYNNALFTNEVDIGSNMTRKDVVWLVWRLSLLK